MFLKLPAKTWILIGAVLLVALTILFIYAGTDLFLLVLAGLLIIAMLVTGVVILRLYLEKKSAQNQPQDPDENGGLVKSKLNEIRRSFSSGLQTFQASGKSVYRLPWYLLIGEPDSGKTEAIRNSAVGFPSGLHREPPAPGTTHNLHWWFTNHGVLIDIAGRLLIEDQEKSDFSEWSELFELLRRHRSKCPINGLILTLPVDSLLGIPREIVTRKATQLARQLNLAQQRLDIRFPVYVLVTKSDLLCGFREYCESFSSTSARHQMIGWSNPTAPEEPLDLSHFEKDLQTLIPPLEALRWKYLRETQTLQSGERKINSLDATFAFPHTLSLVLPNIIAFLQPIFSSSEWSAKPLFLRGVYFASALYAGPTLDLELAQTFNVPLDQLPKTEERISNGSYFLRDLFIKKIFREKGLVVRATDATLLVKRRQTFILGSIAAASAILLFLSIAGEDELKRVLGFQSYYWEPAASEKHWLSGRGGAGPDIWRPLISPDSPTGSEYSYRGDESILQNFADRLSLLDYQQHLIQVSQRSFPVSWVYYPLLSLNRLKDRQKKAQQTLLEAGVIRPLFEATRRKMLQSSLSEDSADDFIPLKGALVALIEVESDAIKPLRGFSTPASAATLPALIRYATKQSLADRDQRTMTDLIDETFLSRRKATWPPSWLPLGVESLENNKPIREGLKTLVILSKTEIAREKRGLEALQKLFADLNQFKEKEANLNASIADPESRSIFKSAADFYSQNSKARQALDELKTTKESIDHDLRLLTDDDFSENLVKTYKEIVKLSQEKTQQLFGEIQEAIADHVTPINKDEGTPLPNVLSSRVSETKKTDFKDAKEIANLVGRPKARLFPEIQEMILKQQDGMTAIFDHGFKPEEITEMKALDHDLLEITGPGSKERKYALRLKIYQHSRSALDSQEFVSNDPLNDHWNMVDEIHSDISSRRFQIKASRLPGDFAAADYFLSKAESDRVEKLLSAYIEGAAQIFQHTVFYPLVKEGQDRPPYTLSEIRSVLGTLEEMEKSIGSERLKTLPPDHPQYRKLLEFKDNLAKIRVRASSLGENTVTVSLPRYDDSPTCKMGFKSLDHFRSVLDQNGDMKKTNSSEVVQLGLFNIDDPISVCFVNYSNSNEIKHPVSLGSGLEAKTRGRMRVEPEKGFPVYLDIAFKNGPIDINSLPSKADILAQLGIK